jgi:hypothetical protein
MKKIYKNYRKLNTSRLSKKTRHKIYKLALNYYINSNYNIGICGAIGYALIELGYLESMLKIVPLNPIINMSKYPEIFKHKPKGVDDVWWPINNITVRTRILKQAIEETK